MDSSIALAIQSWVLYALAVSLILARVFFRRITLSSFSYLQADDWIMVTVLPPFTAAIVLANAAPDAKPVSSSNLQYALEELQLIVTWLVKACLLVLYWRIFPVATSAPKRMAIKVVASICAVSFVVIQGGMIAWRVMSPDDSFLEGELEPHITTKVYCIMALSLGALTTLLVLVIPVPFIPTPRKFLLSSLVMFGVLVMACGVIARISHFTRYSDLYLFWYTAETALIIIFANLPFLTAPARVRENFSRKLSSSADHQRPVSHWPRSRSSHEVEECDKKRWDSVVGSTTTMPGGLPSLKEYCEEAQTPERGSTADKDLEMQSLGVEGPEKSSH